MIIGLSGYARSGKDTVAKMLITHQRRAFADAMRNALYILNPYIADGIRLREAIDEHGWELVKTGFPEVRRLLQIFGTEIGRKMIADDVWVQMSTRDLKPEDNIVFSDVRFPNEAQAIKALGGVVWRIERPGVDAVNAHVSETSMDGWEYDAIIDNSGTLEDLLAQVETATLFAELTQSTSRHV